LINKVYASPTANNVPQIKDQSKQQVKDVPTVQKTEVKPEPPKK
jgi:hypothetical protein